MNKKEYIQSKIRLLRNFCILKRNDAREAMVRKILEARENEIQIDQFLHDILRGEKTIDEAIGGAI
jgi:hypothetical protein